MADNINNITSTVDVLMNNMEHLIGSKTVIGEPTRVGDATIIPLIDVSFGIAAGAGARNGSKNSSAGGMNAKLTPSAILVMQNGHTKLISVKGTDTITKITDLVPELIDKLKNRGKVNVDKEAAVESAFPDGTDESTEQA